jgi:MSHA biogenesis protein MshQ
LVNGDFSARWTGFIVAPESGAYQFQIINDDGARLRVGGQLLVNDWANGPARTNTTAAVTLVAGQRYPVTVEFFDSAGGGEIRLRWRKPSDGGFSAVPAAVLRPGAVDWPAGLLPRERLEFGGVP